MQNEDTESLEIKSKALLCIHENECNIDDYEMECNDFSWSLIWTMAFPTFLPRRIFIDIFNDARNHEIIMKNEKQVFQLEKSKMCDEVKSEKNEIETHDMYNCALHTTWCLLAYRQIFGDVLGVETVQKIVEKQSQDVAMNNLQIEANISQENNLGYGEITPKSVMELIAFLESLHFHKNDRVESLFKGGTILDLGSGTGRVIFAAALTHFFDHAFGVEIVEDLHNEALENRKKWEDMHPYSEAENAMSTDHTQFTFLHDDITTYSKQNSSSLTEYEEGIIDASSLNCIISSLQGQSFNIILIHCTLFDSVLMQYVQQICQDCPKDTYFITVSKPLSVEATTGIVLLEESQREMTWGFGTIFIQQKI